MPIHLPPPWWRLRCLLEPLAQRLHQLLPAAERRHKRLLFLGEVPFGEPAQPFQGNLPGHSVEPRLRALEVRAEHEVEAVEMTLVLDQRRARQMVEVN